jgi:hypothetical protein
MRRIIMAFRLGKDGRPTGFGCFSNLKLYCQEAGIPYGRVTKDPDWAAGKPYFDKDRILIRMVQNRLVDISADMALESLAKALPKELAGMIERAETQAMVLKRFQKVYELPEEKIYPG